ncbi:hypothetical protein ACFFJN_05170 [Erwinia mallotivora]|uniref:hypothetical protein n=1 Tax=Erwinia mallotivora TaxID=69222 RepID=UPI0035EC024C
MKNFSQQLDLLSSGQHETQTERSAMLSLTNSTSDSSSWFSGLHQMVNANDDADFLKVLNPPTLLSASSSGKNLPVW